MGAVMSAPSATLAHYIDGASVPGRSERFAEVFNPAIGEPSSRVPLANGEEVNLALASAAAALPAWAATPPAQRAQVLFRYLSVLQANADALAEVISAEHGKTLADAKVPSPAVLKSLSSLAGFPTY